MPTGSWARNARAEQSRFRAAISPVYAAPGSASTQCIHLEKLVGPGGEFSRRAPNLYQPACKPGSVWRAWLDARVTAIPLRRRLPGAFSNLPGRRDPDIDPETAPCSRSEQPRAVPIRSCSRWGLPCRLRCRRRGALLPHRFTLTVPAILRASGGDGAGGLFSVTLSLGSRPPDVIRHRMSMEPGLSSRADLSALARAAVRPTDVVHLGAFRDRIKLPPWAPPTAVAAFRWSTRPRRRRRARGGSGAGTQ